MEAEGTPFSAVTSTELSSDSTMQLIGNMMSTGKYNIKITLNDDHVSSNGDLERENQILKQRIECFQQKMKSATQLIHEITKEVGFPFENGQSIVSPEFQENFKAHVNKIMIDYNKRKVLINTPIVLQDIFNNKLSLVAQTTPLQNGEQNITRTSSPGDDDQPDHTEGARQQKVTPSTRPKQISNSGDTHMVHKTSFSKRLPPSAPTTGNTVGHPRNKRKKVQNYFTFVRRSLRKKTKVNRFIEGKSDSHR